MGCRTECEKRVNAHTRLAELELRDVIVVRAPGTAGIGTQLDIACPPRRERPAAAVVQTGARVRGVEAVVEAVKVDAVLRQCHGEAVVVMAVASPELAVLAPVPGRTALQIHLLHPVLAAEIICMVTGWCMRHGCARSMQRGGA